MSFPFRLNVRPDTFSRLVEYLRSVVERFPDARTGGETVYTMADAALGAFAVFFTQSPSFLNFQRTLQVAKGCNNALSLFGLTQIPSDNQIRNLLDPVPPSALSPVFAAVVDALHAGGQLAAYRSINDDLLVAMDGTQYFSSANIHCSQCTVTKHKNGTVTYSHSVLTPVIVAPGNARVIPLEPEFITPRMGMRNRTARTPRPNAGSPNSARVIAPWASPSWVTTSTASSRCAKPSASRG